MAISGGLNRPRNLSSIRRIQIIMDKKLYIAYGSNLNIKQMANRCPTAKIVGTSMLKDWRLLFRGQHAGAVATVEPFKGGNVPVLVWERLLQTKLHSIATKAGPSFTERKR